MTSACAVRMGDKPKAVLRLERSGGQCKKRMTALGIIASALGSRGQMATQGNIDPFRISGITIEWTVC